MNKIKIEAMKDEIRKIIFDNCGGTPEARDKATNELLALFNVSQQRKLLLAYSSSKENVHAVRGEFTDEVSVDMWLANNCG